MRNIRPLIIIGIAALQLALFSCVNDTKKKNKERDLVVFEEDSIITPVDEKIFYRFPSPEEIFKFIKSSDLQYNSGFLNPPYNVKKYAGTKKQAINLGIYISDLAYITMFDQHEASLDYFVSIHGLSEEIKISSCFDEPLVKRISENMGVTDSLVVIAGDAYTKIVDYLVEHEQEDLLALVSAGALVESLYLTINYVDEYDKNNKIIDKIIKQKFVVENLTQYVKQNQNDVEVLKNINDINNIFSKLTEQKTETTVEEAASNMLVIGGGSTLSISPEEFKELKKTIVSIRNNYIKTE